MKLKIIFFILFVCLIAKAGLCEKVFINPEQPISVGEPIYIKGITQHERGLYFVRNLTYTYLGVTDNSLKIKFERMNTLVSDEADVQELNLPLNDKKQALLKIKTIDVDGPGHSEEIVLTVVDEFFRITAEPYNQ